MPALAVTRSVVELRSDGLPLNVGALPATWTALFLPGSLWMERAGQYRGERAAGRGPSYRTSL